jgi:hypothetical protein
MDISSLGGPDSILNWEHGSKDRPGQVVGKVTFARKIMKKDDAKSERELYFWNKAKKPFVYIKAELFDGLGHSGAEDVAAMLKYKNKDKGEDSRLVVGFSIEGGKIEKKGMLVTKSIARDVAITIKPCNKICDAEVIEGKVSDDFLYKNQNFDCEIIHNELSISSTSVRSILLDSIKKSEWKPSKEDKEQIKELKITPKAKELIEEYNTDNNMRKALIAGMVSGSPDSRTGMAALAPEHLEGKLEKPFKSKSQRKFAYANPEKFGGKEGVKEWESKTPKNIPEKIEKNVPSLEYRKIAGENIPRQDVQKVTFENPAESLRINRVRGDKDFSPTQKGATRFNKNKQKSYAYDLSASSTTPDQSREQMVQAQQIKNKINKNPSDNNFPKNQSFEKISPGYGNYPTTQQHESLHHHLNRFEIKNPQENSQDMRHSLIRHSLGYFEPEVVNSVKKYLMSHSKYQNKSSQKIDEETLTHLSDYRTNPKLRQKIRQQNKLTHPEHIKKLDRSIKSSWKNLIPDAKEISSEHLQHIHNRFSKEKPENVENFYKELRLSFKNEK